MASPFVEVEAAGLTVQLTNPDRVYFPARGETKLDLANYYLSVADGIVRALHDRPCMLHRYPDGVGGEKIYQKRLPKGAPDWVETAEVSFPSGRTADELCVTELAAVGWAGQMATGEFHPWDTPGGGRWRIRTSCASISIQVRARASRRRSWSPASCTKCWTSSARSGGR